MHFSAFGTASVAGPVIAPVTAKVTSTIEIVETSGTDEIITSLLILLIIILVAILLTPTVLVKGTNQNRKY